MPDQHEFKLKPSSMVGLAACAALLSAGNAGRFNAGRSNTGPCAHDGRKRRVGKKIFKARKRKSR